MSALSSARHAIVKLFEVILIVLVAVLTLVVLWGVFTRYTTRVLPVIGGQAEYTEELARLLLIWVSTFGAALAFERKAHLGVDFFVDKLHPEAARVVAVIVQLLVIAMALIVFIIGGGKLAAAQMGQKLATMSFMNRGIVYLAFPISGIFIALFSLENMLDLIKKPAINQDATEGAEG